MYSGGFYPFTTLEEHWAYWSRYIYINRYQNPPKSVYGDLLKLIQNTCLLYTSIQLIFKYATIESSLSVHAKFSFCGLANTIIIFPPIVILKIPL